MTTPDVVRAVEPVIAALVRMGVPYYVGGSVASSAYGMARTTLDVDLVADLLPEHVGALARRLEDNYYLDEATMADAVRRRSSFNLIHLDTLIKVDVFSVKRDEYGRVSLGRRREDCLDESYGARRLFLSSPEDVILNKLDWFRQGGGVSERQWNDTIGVLKVQAGRLDLDYLRHWAAALGLADLLERALDEAS